MPIPEMQRVRITAHVCHKEKIVAKLQELGIVEVEILSDIPELHTVRDEPDTATVEREIAELKYALDFLHTFEPKKPTLLESFFSPKYGIEKEYYTKIVENYDLSVIDTIRMLDQKLSDLKNEKARLKSVAEQLQPWKSLLIPLDSLETKETVTELGILPNEYLNELSLLEYVHVEISLSTKRKSWVAVTLLKSFKEDVEEMLRKMSFQKISLPRLEGTPCEALERINSQVEEIQSEIKAGETQCRDLARERFNLMILYDHYQALRIRHEVRQSFINTEKSFVLEGWIKKNDTKILEEALSSFREADIFFRDPEELENVPVDIDNKGIVKPFEVVTRIYGLPLYREIDPTILLAPFFIVFFALCLSDVIYGLLLVGFSVYILKRVRTGPDARLLFKLLMLGGFLAMGAGLITGGWAGDLPQYLPWPLSFLETLRTSLASIDPLKSPLVMLEISLALGLFQVWMGIFIRGYLNARDGHLLDAVLDQGLWLILLPAGTLTLTNKMFGASIPYPDLMYKISLGAVVGLIVTQGRYQKASNLPLTLMKKILVGFLGVYSVFGYLGDVLSYSRILALGLASSALAAAFNLVAAQIGGIQIVGPILMVGILIVVHLLNLTISVLGAFVHSGRLQFVEYFTKFLEGGGRTFKPFGSYSRYTKIKEVI